MVSGLPRSAFMGLLLNAFADAPGRRLHAYPPSRAVSAPRPSGGRHSMTWTFLAMPFGPGTQAVDGRVDGRNMLRVVSAMLRSHLGVGMDEARLRRIGSSLLLLGTAALAVQVLISLTWLDGAVPFILVVSGPQLPAGLWVLLPWGNRRVLRYVPPIIAAVWVAYWNAAILLEGNTGPTAPEPVMLSLFVLILIEAVVTIAAAILFVWAWRVGSRSAAAAVTESSA